METCNGKYLNSCHMGDEARKPIDFGLYILLHNNECTLRFRLPQLPVEIGHLPPSERQMDRNAVVYYFPCGMTRVSHIAATAVNPRFRKALEL